MDKATKAIVWCLAIVALGEVGLRVVEATPVPAEESAPRFETDRPFVFVLGTSRARRGLWPLRIERAWAQETGRRPWVGIIWEKAVTNIGFHKLYMQEVRPWAARAELPNGILAIEICGASMNDSYLRDDEARYARINTFERDLAAGDLDAAARQLRVRSLRFTEVRGIFDDRFGVREEDAELTAGGQPGAGDDSSAAAGEQPLGHYLRRYRWGQGYKGFDPREGTIDDLEFEKISEQYTGTLLKNYRRGGVQTDYLRRLVEEARADSFRVVFFVMPITEAHRSFWPAGAYDEHIRSAEELARELGVPMLNFDRDFAMDPDEFRDTNHLKVDGAERFSREFARRLARTD